MKFSTVGGGQNNKISGFYHNAIVGGLGNACSLSLGCFIGCGESDTIMSDSPDHAIYHSAIVSGISNTVKANKAVILGGSNNTIHSAGDHSLAFGENVEVHTEFTAAFFSESSPGKVGINNPEPTSALHIKGESGEGYDQLRLQDKFFPVNSADDRGEIGDIAWNENYIYIKVSDTGTDRWKRAELLGSW